MQTVVDVVVGGGYGDEGKGTIAYQLAREGKYGIYVRAGAENAEHRVVTPSGAQHVRHILPVGGIIPRPVDLVLCAGMTFSLDGLRREMQYIVPGQRVIIHENAAIISPELRERGRAAAEARGSTFLGVGATMAAKVRRHGGVKTAGDCRGQLERMGPVLVVPDSGHWSESGQEVLLEGSQGTMLSLDHGHYPYCTSRNMTAMGCLDQAGMNWQQVREVLLVIKALPTRVPGNSGPTGGEEMTWEEVCEESGRPFEQIRQTSHGEDGSAGDGAGGVERPFRLSLLEIERAISLNGPTGIVLTFLDWWSYDDLGVQMVGDLSIKSRRLIAAINEITRSTSSYCPVVMVRTGPAYEDYVNLGWSHPVGGGR
jgi:adenylosuccinate synthase